MEGLWADRLLRVGAAHSMNGTVVRAVALRGGEIVTVSPRADGLDGLVGLATQTLDAPDLTLLPAFGDAHEHLLEAARNTTLVDVGNAQSIGEFQAAIHNAAKPCPAVRGC